MTQLFLPNPGREATRSLFAKNRPPEEPACSCQHAQGYHLPPPPRELGQCWDQESTSKKISRICSLKIVGMKERRTSRQSRSMLRLLALSLLLYHSLVAQLSHGEGYVHAANADADADANANTNAMQEISPGNHREYRSQQ